VRAGTESPPTVIVTARWPATRLARLTTRLARLSGWRADLAALLAGALSALALPPVHALPVLLLSVPLLLCLIQGARRASIAARRGWWFGFGYYVAGLYWITEAILVEAARFWWLVPLAVPALAAVLALFTAAATGVARKARPGWQTALTLAGAWMLTDLARQFIATGFPWNPLGSVWELPDTVGDVLIQPAALVGVHGMTFATVLLAATPLLGWAWRLAGVALFALWCGFGIVRLNQPAPPAPDLTILLVQGNVAQGQKWDQSLMVTVFRRYLSLTRDGFAQQSRLDDGRAQANSHAEAGQQAEPSANRTPVAVIWPETASPALLQTDATARALIAEAAGNAPALIGSVRFDEGDRPRNSLFALGVDGAIEAIYDKWHLVPFGEYQPDWLPVSIQIVPGGGFARGPGPRTLHIPGLPPIGALICYEAIFSSQVVDRVDRPAWMVNVTNDAWFGNSAGPRQHLAAARLRAVEEGLPLLRAANTGISAAFDAKGHELGRIGMRTSGVLPIRLPGTMAAPLYARVGLALPAGMGLLAVLYGLIAGRTRRRCRSEEADRINYNTT